MWWKPNDDWCCAETIHQTLRKVNTIKNEKGNSIQEVLQRISSLLFFQLFILEGHHFEASSFVFCCSCLFAFNLESLKQTRELIKKLFLSEKKLKKNFILAGMKAWKGVQTNERKSCWNFCLNVSGLLKNCLISKTIPAWESLSTFLEFFWGVVWHVLTEWMKLIHCGTLECWIRGLVYVVKILLVWCRAYSCPLLTSNTIAS